MHVESKRITTVYTAALLRIFLQTAIYKGEYGKITAKKTGLAIIVSKANRV